MVRADHIQPGMYVCAKTFEAHVVYLQKHFVVLALDDLLERWRIDQLDADKAYCVITFDDGWQDNYQFALPVLKQYGLPATIFLATDFIGTDRWFWPDQVMYLLEDRAQPGCGDSREEYSRHRGEEQATILFSDGLWTSDGFECSR
jgi:hypothetical protein